MSRFIYLAFRVGEVFKVIICNMQSCGIYLIKLSLRVDCVFGRDNFMHFARIHLG